MSSANSAFSDAPSNSNFTGALSIRTQPILQPGAGPSAIPSANEFLFHLPAESQALSDAIGDAVIVYSTQDERTRFVYSNESNSIQRFVVEILWDGSLLLTEAARTLTNTMASLRQDVGADGNLFPVPSIISISIPNMMDLSTRQVSFTYSEHAPNSYTAVNQPDLEQGSGPPVDPPAYSSVTLLLMNLSMTPDPSGIGWLPFPDRSLPGLSRTGLKGAKGLMEPFRSGLGAVEPTMLRLKISEILRGASEAHKTAFKKTLRWWFPLEQSASPISAFLTWIVDSRGDIVQWLVEHQPQTTMAVAFKPPTGRASGQSQYPNLIAVYIDPNTEEASDLYRVCEREQESAAEAHRNRQSL